jgi:hypothetical protein
MLIVPLLWGNHKGHSGDQFTTTVTFVGLVTMS